MRQTAIRVLLALLVAVFCVFVGYHAWNTHKPSAMQTEPVFEYTVSRSVSGTGIAVRQEQVIAQQVTGVGNYLFEDGARVSVGEVIAEFHADARGVQNIGRMREIEEEIELLQEAQDKNINNFANADVINRNLKDELGVLVSMSGSGRYHDLRAVRMSLQSLVNKRQVASDTGANFEDHISSLRAQHAQLVHTASQSSISNAVAPKSGYFSHLTDGWESLMSPKQLENMTFEDCAALIDDSTVPAPSGNPIGRLVTDSSWYFLLEAPAHETEWIAVGQEARLAFEGIPSDIPATVVDILLHKNADTAVLLLRCNYINRDLINLRRSDATLSLKQYSGLRINNSWIRFNSDTNESGVYVLDDKTVRFKKIQIIYQDANFVLSAMNFSEPPYQVDEELVSLYDQVIIVGSDLYDGKILQ